MRSVLIFGNGLGKALNPAYFDLSAGLFSVWNNTAHLSLEHKALITNAIPGTDPHTPPYSEEQLDKLHGAIGATEYLNSFESNGISWVTPYAKQVPSAFRTFLHEVGMYFHNSGQSLPATFTDPLASFIRETASHVATLNYDNLLYDSLIARGLLHGYDYLLDGFSPEFSENTLLRYYPNRQSYYLHLHGSPLYIDNRKCTGAARVFLGPTQNNHIVLTHVQHKPFYIQSSPILSAYWRHLDLAVMESNRIFLIGYSGDDSHLNYLLSVRSDKEVVIVEWAGAGDIQTRLQHWQQRLGHTNIVLFPEQNILNFDDWYRQRPVQQIQNT